MFGTGVLIKHNSTIDVRQGCSCCYGRCGIQDCDANEGSPPRGRKPCSTTPTAAGSVSRSRRVCSFHFYIIKLLSTYPTSRIFVPSNRNTLVDILLGRNVAGNSPKKSRARSRSRSPVKKVGKKARCLYEGETLDVENITSLPKRRTSPRKIPRHVTQEKEGENPEAGMWHCERVTSTFQCNLRQVHLVYHPSI